jgi:Tol biopolymer transport system component
MYVLRLKRGTNLLKVSVVAAAVMLAACFVALAARVEPSQAVFPGQNGKIAFSTFRDGHVQQSERGSWPSAEIYVMDADGSNKIKVSPEGHYAYDPKWSPDGSKIVFTSHREGEVDQFGNRALEIYTVNADGSNLTNISNNPASDSGADWQALSVPTTKADCKDVGYEAFGFKNHGECIASVQRAAKSE